MSISAVSKRLAATGVATALATGALVSGTTGTSSAAVSGGATYTCTVPLLNVPVDVPLSISADALPTEVLADFGVPGGLLPVGGGLEVGGLLGLLSAVPGVTQLGAKLDGFAMLLGNVPVPVPLEAPVGELNPLAAVTGNVGAFKTPAKAGAYDISLPDAFSLVPLGLPIPLDALPCALKDGQDPKVGTVDVTKQSADLRVVRAVKKGKAAKVVAQVVRQDSSKAAGKVAAFVKGTKVASKQLKAGRANLKVKNLKGASKVVVKYLGNSSTKAAKKSVKLR
ncbi:hypothetical protein [Nocardioides sp. SYSU DS0663]|uniref:hypothetical protein n=1 Tax=Nocardioides sp. SYSU DS0663 TaxID=3416445 RepID=UPI003F4B9EFE